MTISINKRIQGNYVLSATGTVTIDSNLIVTGTTTTVNSTETTISDRSITLNSGEVGSGVFGIYSGIEVDRGLLDTVALRWNEGTDIWELTKDGSAYSAIATSSDLSAFLTDVIDDISPQLGGNLDVNGKTITSASGGDVTITADGSGQLKLNKVVSMQDQGSAPSATAGYNKLYSSSTQGGGGTGLYFVNSTTTDELASRTKAIVYSLIF
tara:strand:+ start:348 stop:980 length:633 start_codon:yes stop_codon:yes gene_type:complete